MWNHFTAQKKEVFKYDDRGPLYNSNKRSYYSLFCITLDARKSLNALPANRFSKIQLVVYYQCCVLIGYML